jgi:hypothetical protein
LAAEEKAAVLLKTDLMLQHKQAEAVVVLVHKVTPVHMLAATAVAELL